MSKSRKGEMALEALRAFGRKRSAQHHTTVGHHPLRPPHPEGAQHDRTRDYVPEGRRQVMRHTDSLPPKPLPGHMSASVGNHDELAHEVSNGLRKFTFGQVRRQQPTQRLQ